MRYGHPDLMPQRARDVDDLRAGHLQRSVRLVGLELPERWDGAKRSRTSRLRALTPWGATGDKHGLVRGINPIGCMADAAHVQLRNRSHDSSLGAKLRGFCDGAGSGTRLHSHQFSDQKGHR